MSEENKTTQDTPKVETDAEMKNDTSTANESGSQIDSKSGSENENKEETTNDGVKILEEVFGKASVDDKEEARPSESKEGAIGPEPPK